VHEESIPLEVVSDQIADGMIYKSKMDLVNKMRKDMLEQAKNNNGCAVYEH
jgi:hypothetical protein